MVILKKRNLLKKVVLTASAILALNLPAKADTHYVSESSAGPLYPYTTLETAAREIEPALSASSSDDTILVYDGIYYPTNTLIIRDSRTLKGANGSHAAIIDAVSNGAVNAIIVGSGGFSGNSSGTVERITVRNGISTYGAGVYVNRGVVDNCIISNNYATINGGGVETAYGGIVKHSTIENNFALNLGGGIYAQNFFGRGDVLSCIIRNNSAGTGGGIFVSRGNVINCLIHNNLANVGGGITANEGSYGEQIVNNTIVENSADGIPTVASLISPSYGGTYLPQEVNIAAVGQGGGANAYYYKGDWNYNIIYDNTPNDFYGIYYGRFLNSCIEKLPEPWYILLTDNITNRPIFNDSQAKDFTLKWYAPQVDRDKGINSTNYFSSSEDMLGIKRPQDGNGDGVQYQDIGCYEKEPLSITSDTDGDGMTDIWEVQKNLKPLQDDSQEDIDGDKMNNLGEYISGTNPRDLNDVLKIEKIEKDSRGCALYFPTKTNRIYNVYATPDFVNAWSNISQNIEGKGSLEKFLDSDMSRGNKMYKIDVRF